MISVTTFNKITVQSKPVITDTVETRRSVHITECPYFKIYGAGPRKLSVISVHIKLVSVEWVPLNSTSKFKILSLISIQVIFDLRKNYP